MQVMNSNGSAVEPCQVLSNVSIIAYSTLVSDRIRLLSPIVIFCFEKASEWQACTDSSCGFGGRRAW